MLINKNGFDAFSEYDLRANLENVLKNLCAEIESDTSVSACEEEEYVRNKLQENMLARLVIDINSVTVTQREEQIPSEYFPWSFDAPRGRNFPKPVVTYYVPFTGDTRLLKCRPSTWLMNSHEIAIDGKNIMFDVINFNNDAEQVKKESSQVIQYLAQQSSHINKDISDFNEKLDAIIRGAFGRAKVKFQEQTDFLGKLGHKVNKL